MLGALYDIRELLQLLVRFVEETMAKKKKQIYKEWWEQHREQFERTDRAFKELFAKWEAENAAKQRPVEGR